jgi:AraC-like DNA-binding protein
MNQRHVKIERLLPWRVLYRVRESPGSISERVRAFRPGLDGVTEVFHAAFTNHVYPPHSHQTWTVLIVDAGAIRYDIDHDDRGADTKRVTVLPPHVAHDGESAHPGRGFRKRVLYLDTEVIEETLVGRAVDDSTLEDAALRAEISILHDAFERPREDLEWETMLERVVRRILGHLTGRSDVTGPQSASAAETLRDFLDSRPVERHRFDDVSHQLGWSKTHLIRSFTNEFGIPPHRYLISKRVDEARRRLLAGEPPAKVAVDVGFHDQAHLTRHFRALLATTPGRFQRG